MDYILALGGSIICPKKIDTDFLKGFYDLIVKRINSGDRFVIITGGGDVAREYQRSAGLVNGVSDEEKDWLGVYATYLNGHLIRSIFNKFAHPEVMNERGKISSFGDRSLIVGSGWKPGWSTDYVATQTAIDLNIDNILVLSKQDYIYDKNPDQYSNAEPIKEITWKEYEKIIPDEWTPGLKAPFDPVATGIASREDKKVIVANGTDLRNLELIFEGGNFKGTTLK